jgi:DNA-binding transcriptional MerR regulator
MAIKIVRPPEADQWLSSGAAQVALGLHPHTLRKYAKAGLIEAVRTPGGQFRYNVSKYLRERQAKTEHPGG